MNFRPFANKSIPTVAVRLRCLLWFRVRLGIGFGSDAMGFHMFDRDAVCRCLEKRKRGALTLTRTTRGRDTGRVDASFSDAGETREMGIRCRKSLEMFCW
jgi:hypothetical protein